MTTTATELKNGRESDVGRVTLRDIADEVGMSHATVSLALRDSPKVSAKTRGKVKKTANEMGYAPDPMLRSLTVYRRCSSARPAQSVIAWISHGDCQRSDIRSCLEGAKEAACKKGYRVDEFDAKGMRPVRLAQILETRGVHGMIVPPSSSLELRDFPIDRFAIVRIDWNVMHTDTHCVSPADSFNVITAFKEMRNKGYKRIGYVGSQTSRFAFSSNDLQGVRDCFGGMETPVLVLDGDDRDGHRSALDAWIKNYQIDAALVDREDVPERIRELGYRIPEDIALAAASLHGSSIDAGIDQNLNEVGRVAINTLNNMICDFEYGLPSSPRMIMVGGVWVDGDSMPAASSRG